MQDTKDHLEKERDMAMAASILKIILIMKETLLMVLKQDREHTFIKGQEQNI